jgi:hypothetical protein
MNEKLINILVRTCKRPAYFQFCMDSIFAQFYQNFKIIIGIESGDDETLQYVNHFIDFGSRAMYFHIPKEKIQIVRYDRIEKKINIPISSQTAEYGLWFPYNHYLDIMAKSVDDGWLLFLDDDDCFKNNNALKIISQKIKTVDDLLFWRVKFPDKIIPEQKYWETMNKYDISPFPCHISGIGFSFHKNFVKDIEWGYWKLADYRVAKKLFQVCTNKIYINDILTGLQDNPNNGRIIDKIIKS